MKFLTNCIGFMAVLCVVDPSWAAARTAPTVTGTTESRVAYNINTANAARNRRLPTIATVSGATVTTTGTKSTMTADECVDAYSECIRGSDACGSDFEECTTNTLFHAQMPKCSSTLLQCSSSAINTLFGNSNITALANKDSKEEYLYPTKGSILGQFIEASEISNRLDTTNCVKKYTSCLKKESVCGADFELCTDNTEFKKQKVFCESTLARCQSDGVKELLGSDNRAAMPTAASRIGIMITEGANLAAVNAVSTCYKVVDQCFMSACEQNPFKCLVDSDAVSANIAEAIATQSSGATKTLSKATLLNVAAGDTVQKSQVSGYVKGECVDKIGANKYCYATFLGEGQMPKAADLLDEDNRSEIFNEAYNARMNNPAMQAKIQQLADKFDKKTKDKCVETITACAMRSCGGGVGSMCYASVRANTGNSINAGKAYQEVKTGCEALVNTDANCQYAASKDSTYRYSDSTAFGILFPEYEEGFKDPLAVVGSLNSTLVSSYNDAAMEKFAKQCKTTATSCIKSMCGKDYINCYRSRTDILSDTYNTGESKFDISMNKVGGVLDFTIVTGLCMETVKNAKACEEHFGVLYAQKNAQGDSVSGWGTADSVRSGWADAVSGGYSANAVQYVDDTGLCVLNETELQKDACRNKATESMECGQMDEDGCVYDKPEQITHRDYQLRMDANTLFREVLADAEKEAQAKYNAKLNKEQQMCLAQNNGGVLGRNDMTGSTYQWVKLKSTKVPKNYSTSGLSPNAFVTSNDLYGSFCRARVTVQSDDPDIQEELRKGTDWSTAYFAVGDAFTCGSWIPQDKLTKIGEAAGCKKAGYEYKNGKCNVEMTTGQKWAVAASTIGAAGAGYGLTELLQNKTSLGGLLGSTAGVSKSSDVKKLEESWGEWEAFKDNGGRFCNKVDENANKDKDKDCYTVKSNGLVDGLVVKNPKWCSSNCQGSDFDDSEKDTYLDKLKEKLGYDESGNKKKGNTWIASTSVAGVSALATGLGVGMTIKAKNNEKLTAAQREWLDEVGSHIICYVGADEAGTYGDVIEIGLE